MNEAEYSEVVQSMRLPVRVFVLWPLQVQTLPLLFLHVLSFCMPALVKGRSAL